MLTAISATHRVASSSSTIPERKAYFSEPMVEARCLSPRLRTTFSGPFSRPRARRVGRPSTRSSICAHMVRMSASSFSERPTVSLPTRIMNRGISGRVNRAIRALVRSSRPMVTRHSGVTVRLSSSCGT